MSKVRNETKYCIVLKQAKIREGNIGYGIEKIFVKALNQEEIRFVYFKDTLRKKQQLIARPLDLPEDDLIELIKESVNKNVFSKEFILNLKEIVKG
ncbi:hypothetical protein GOD97_05800 [Paeniclostridium sordellii]|uniref:hypothetical protein n=1 Tax=Paraclostridium sordellii TaxID=1505 RepID=UPI0012EE753F|nr:hypothetical protein [Paeniclostridium sordellii]MDU6483047.1 hypothetical protein [Paeniclostridium sordellii]MVO74243.1 hypothetical protein [Paeniclostridium sordellii]